MADAIRDDNHVSSLIALSYLDGVTPVKVVLTSGAMKIDTTHTVAVPLPTIDGRDANRVPTALGVSSSNSAVLRPLFADPATGAVLVATS